MVQPEIQKSIFKVIYSRRMITAFLMGFSCGLPLLLTITVLQAWMKEEGIDLTVIGLMALVGLPYTLKFLWAPFIDRYTLPFLGRRRGWLLMAQIFLFFSIIALGLSNPGVYPLMMVFTAFTGIIFTALCVVFYQFFRNLINLF